MNYYSDELGLIYTFSVEIIFYIMNMDGIGTKYHYIDSIDNTYEDSELNTQVGLERAEANIPFKKSDSL
ncbi:hypothetical protein CWI38_1107p0010 [Hamiltosporidium tvaerminnensis]|uniref:Uncharacterized protein n=1 Tax=Hamiltosporidium tvaerminnensis TaxID=1176355 RepID=A0A4V2JXG3_9MICR|nr:hypothetical protein CWI38_1107p0010 [Hamiltosporidium tvaerminnensis]